jgi:hypothetical protein
MFNSIFRSKTLKTVMVSCAMVCCLAITIYSSIETKASVSQADVIQKENVNFYTIGTGIFLSKPTQQIHCIKSMKLLFQLNIIQYFSKRTLY